MAERLAIVDAQQILHHFEMVQSQKTAINERFTTT